MNMNLLRYERGEDLVCLFVCVCLCVCVNPSQSEEKKRTNVFFFFFFISFQGERGREREEEVGKETPRNMKVFFLIFLRYGEELWEVVCVCVRERYTQTLFSPSLMESHPLHKISDII